MNQMDIEQARFNMIEQQVRPWDVLDQRVLDVMSTVPREAFVPDRYRALAFADTNIPLGHGQVMMAPNVEGRLLQVLDIKPGDTIYEVGTGSGFLTACLASLGKQVTSTEILPELSESAGQRLTQLGFSNVTLEVGDAANGPVTEACYDVIAVTGSLPVLPREFQNHLNTGGRLFVIIGEPPIMEALLITRIDADSWAEESLFETAIPALMQAKTPQRFVF